MKNTGSLLKVSGFLLVSAFLALLWPVITEYGYVVEYGLPAFTDWVATTFSGHPLLGLLAALVLAKDWLFPWLALTGAVMALMRGTRWAAIVGSSLVLSTLVIQTLSFIFLAGMPLERLIDSLTPKTPLQVANYLALVLAFGSLVFGVLAKKTTLATQTTGTDASLEAAQAQENPNPVAYDTQTGRPILGYDTQTGKPIYADEKPQG